MLHSEGIRILEGLRWGMAQNGLGNTALSSRLSVDFQIFNQTKYLLSSLFCTNHCENTHFHKFAAIRVQFVLTARTRTVKDINKYSGSDAVLLKDLSMIVRCIYIQASHEYIVIVSF